MSITDTTPGPVPPSPRQDVTPSSTRGRTGTWSVSRQGVATVTRLELRQRIRSTRWIVSLVVFGVVVGGVTALTWGAANMDQIGVTEVGPTMFGFIVFFVLFLGLLVSPTLTATSINGDRAAGTLATLQVTLLSPAEIVLGKLLAAWLASLAFLAVSVPFVLWAFVVGGTSPLAVVTTLLLLAVVLAVVCALGLGFSSLTARTSGSAVLTYVAVGSLTVLSLIVFALTIPLVSGMETVQVYQERWDPAAEPQLDESGDYVPQRCELTEQETYVSHTERTWWLLAINPFVIVADAAPAPVQDPYRYGSIDPMTAIRDGVRAARLGPPEIHDWCWHELTSDVAADDGDDRGLSPVWPWGLGANLLLAAGAVALAVRRLTIPMHRLPKGTRVA